MDLPIQCLIGMRFSRYLSLMGGEEARLCKFRQQKQIKPNQKLKSGKRDTFPGSRGVSQNTNVCLTLGPMLSALRIRLGIEWDDIIIPAKS